MNIADLEQRLLELDEISLRCDTERALIEPLLAFWRGDGSSRAAPVPNPVPPSPNGRKISSNTCTEPDCGRTFLSVQALRLHQTRTHVAKPTAAAAAPAEPLNADELVRIEPKSNLLDTPPMTTVDDGVLALRCDSCEFAIPVGPVGPLVLHVQDVHHRNPMQIERQPRKAVVEVVS